MLWRGRDRSDVAPCRRKQGANDGRQIRVVHMQAAERGLSSDSRGARTDPALPEPLARASAARFWCRRRAALRSRVPQWRRCGSPPIV
jgi:hypothetical protein